MRAWITPVKLFGWLTRRKQETEKALQPIYGHGGGWSSLTREPFAGAWQRNISINTDSVLTYSAVFACITLIANDIAKLRLRLVKEDDNGIWQEVEPNSPFWPVLRRPNRYNNRIQFDPAPWIRASVKGNLFDLGSGGRTDAQEPLQRGADHRDPARV